MDNAPPAPGRKGDSLQRTAGPGGSAAQLPRLRGGVGHAERQAPEDRLRSVVAHLSEGFNLSASDGTARDPLGRVLVFRPRPGRSLHVVGRSPLAEEFRRLLTTGVVPGWTLHPVPPGRTPLDVLVAPLLRRCGHMRFYNLLEREGFASVEEVAATPDECLLELRNSGPKLITTVRAVISERRPAASRVSAAGTASAAEARIPASTPAILPPDVVPAFQSIVAWAIAECGARTLGDLLTLSAAAAGMPPDIARRWDRLAQLSLRSLASTADLDLDVTQLAEELLSQTDDRRRLILTSRTFAPQKRTYGSLARELSISRERVRQLEASALSQLTLASRHDRYAPLRWRAASGAHPSTTLAAASSDTPPWLAELLPWLAARIG